MITNIVTPWQMDSSYDEKIKWSKTNQHICFKPFDTLQVRYINANKLKIAPCCNYDINFEHQSLELPLHEQFSQLKLNIKNGIKDPGCHRCWDTEKVNSLSERVSHFIEFHGAYMDQRLAGIQKDFSIGISFSNLCNLACRSCFPEISSLYASVTEHKSGLLPVVDISDKLDTWNNIIKKIHNVLDQYDKLNLDLVGGETMIQIGAVRLIDYLVDNNMASRIELRITTNFTTLNKELFEKFKNFKNVMLNASIDSAGQNYHYVRWPAKISKIQENLDLFLTTKTNNMYPLVITSVWGLNNIFYINEYLDFLMLQLQKDSNIRIHVIHLLTPAHLRVETLPVQYRSVLLEYINQALEHPILSYDNTIEMQIFLLQVQKFLSETTVINNYFFHFLKFTADFDKRTKCYFADFNSRLYNILSDSDRAVYSGVINGTINYSLPSL